MCEGGCFQDGREGFRDGDEVEHYDARYGELPFKRDASIHKYPS